MRLNFRQIMLAGTASIVLSTISGCATPIPAEKKADVNQYSSLTTVDAVKKLEFNLKQSAENKLNVYAPDHYSTADKALVDARKLISKNKPREQVVEKVAVASAVLKNGDVVMRRVKDILEDQLVVKEKLDSLDTDKVYRSEYGSLEQRLDSIIREIESGHVEENEQTRSKLLQDMQKLERKSIRYNAMHEPEEILKRVKYRNGEVLAPLTYKDALAVFLRAEEFINQNPNYEIGIEQMGAEALFAAKRALYITEQVASLSQKVNYSLEQVILDEEYRLYRIARELESIDLRDNPLEMQSEELAKIARNRADEYKNKEGLILALRDTLIKVRDSSAELTALSEMSKKLKKEKGEWIAKEALYKAKVSHLENNFNQSQAQLDQTQQKLLSMKDENNQLSNSLNIDKEAPLISQNKTANDKAKTTEEPALLKAKSAEEEKLLTAEEAKHSELETTLNKESLVKKINDQLSEKQQIEREEALANQSVPVKPVPVKRTEANDSASEENKETDAIALEIKQPLTLSKDKIVSKEPDSSTPDVEGREISSTASTTTTNNASETKPNQEIAASTLKTLPESNQPVTTKESADALNSVMELIQQFEPKNELSSTQADPAEAAKQTTQKQKGQQTSEAFVDASE